MNLSLSCKLLFFRSLFLSIWSALYSDEPKSARTPLRVGMKDAVKSKPNRSSNNSETTNSSRKPSSPSAAHVALTPLRAELPPINSPRTPRSTSKKAQQTMEQQRRHDYAQKLFEDLNASVFKGGLPNNTVLNWNKRLLTTAGRARWHRWVYILQQFSPYRNKYSAKDGVETAQIELAEKILDRDGLLSFNEALRWLVIEESHPRADQEHPVAWNVPSSNLDHWQRNQWTPWSTLQEMVSLKSTPFFFQRTDVDIV